MLRAFQRRAHLFTQTIAITVILLSQIATSPTNAAPKAANASLIEQRILAQQGLSLGLATILLQSQFIAQFAISFPEGQCVAPLGSDWGGMQSLSHFETSNSLGGHFRLYFDTACTQLYMDEKVKYKVRSSSPVDWIPAATITVFSRNGRKAGTFELSGHILGATQESRLKIIATATFSPHDGSPQATVALTCEIPPTDVDGVVDIPCGEGIAQNFPDIAMATASVNPIILHTITSGGTTSVTFKQDRHATLYTGALDALSVRVNAKNKIVLDGNAPVYGTDKLSGEAALFGLFPPRPTKWNVKDPEHNADFSIALRNDLTRKLTGAIAPLDNSTALATIGIDQSGTGRIIYSDGTSANISSWVISK